jgi:pyridoxal 5'-phosphate synthase pdxT subunit
MAPRVGILAFQGCIEPHEEILATFGASTVRVTSPHDLTQIDRLILPGGESTTMLRFIKRFEMVPALQEFARYHPVWGICAGAILAARQVHNPSQESLDLIDISAHRNFYGGQLDSFTTELQITCQEAPIRTHFIRAPLLAPLPPTQARPVPTIESSLSSQPIFISQGHIWACSFHIELTGDTTLHQRFIAL